MAATSCIEAVPPAAGTALARHARRVIAEALGVRLAGAPLDHQLPQLEAGVFVTLLGEEALRGCVGSLEGERPVAAAVRELAVAAALDDPRFPPVRGDELPRLTVRVSLLSEPEPLELAAEEELVAALRPGVDGLILGEGRCRGTFLPAVWEAIPEPRRFVRELKRKAGLPEDHWSAAMEAWRYASVTFEDPARP